MRQHLRQMVVIHRLEPHLPVGRVDSVLLIHWQHIGIHDQFGTNSTEAKVTIEADGRAIFSETVKRKDKPKGVTLDIKNVQQLRILVESDSPFFNGSQAVLADARVQK